MSVYVISPLVNFVEQMQFDIPLRILKGHLGTGY